MTTADVYEPTVSVIIPAVNAEATIKDLLDSLMEVDYPRRKREVIVVDGGSTDKTRDIVQAYPAKLIIERRKGINIARNIGVKNSHGEILAFTDSDCVVSKDWIKKIVENFKDSKVGCLGGNTFRYKNDFISNYADNSIIPILRRFKKREILDNVGPYFRFPAGCNMAFRRNILEELNGFDDKIRYGFDEDELAERVCEAGYKMVLDPDVIIKHQHRGTVKALLKQNFNYGRGGGLLLKNEVKGRFSMWILSTLILFFAWLIASFSLMFLTIMVSALFLFPLLFITVIPLALLILFYFYRAVKSKEPVKPLLYPFIDLLRISASYLGVVYELFKVTK